MKALRSIAIATLLALAFAGGGTALQQEKDSQPTRMRPNRLYFGSPPVIPHDAGEEMNECLVCHAAGSIAPETPHPTRVRCRQCHVASSKGGFRGSTFVGLPLPESRSQRVQPNGPRYIPHPVLLRENCLACHSPDSGKDVLATTHPERTRCRQCHVPRRPGAAPPFKDRD